MGKSKYYILIVLLFITPVVSGQGNLVLGKQKATFCSQCHGIDGNSFDQNIPKLAGQLESYIVLQIGRFQQGIRNHPVMSAKVNNLHKAKNLEEMLKNTNAIAAYYASQIRMRGSSSDNSINVEGAKLFKDKFCNYCHGDRGKSIAPAWKNGAPVIGGQHRAYLLTAMKNIRDDRRPGDIYHLMPRVFTGFSKENIEAIANYLSGL